MAQRRSPGSRTKASSSRTKNAKSQIKAKPKLKGTKKLTARSGRATGSKSAPAKKAAAKRTAKTASKAPRKTQASKPQASKPQATKAQASKAAASKAGPKTQASKAVTSLPKPAKSTARSSTRAVQGRRAPARQKGGRPPAFDHTTGLETRTDAAADTRRGRAEKPSQEQRPREAGDESFAPDNLVPGQVGEARTVPKRGDRSARRRDGDARRGNGRSEDAGLDGARLDGSGELAQDSHLAGETRESEIARDTRNTPPQGAAEDYGKAPD